LVYRNSSTFLSIFTIQGAWGWLRRGRYVPYARWCWHGKEDISGTAAMQGGAGMERRIFLAWPPCKVVLAWKGAYFWHGRHARWCWHGREHISGMATMQGGAGF
jgi:hypothetical protein